MVPTRFELTDEQAASQESARGDGRTLEEHLEAYRQGRSGVRIEQLEDDVRVTYRAKAPRLLWRVVAGGVMLVLAGVVGWVGLPGVELGAAMRWTAVAALALLGVTLLGGAWRWGSVQLDANGLRATRRPGPPRSTRRLALAELRRFKVDKAKRGRSQAYHVLALTRNGNQLPVARDLPMKSDAYLLTLLLIDHVKRLRRASRV